MRPNQGKRSRLIRIRSKGTRLMGLAMKKVAINAAIFVGAVVIRRV